MRVNDHNNSPVAFFNLFVHLIDLSSSKVGRVENKVLISAAVVLIRPLNVHPQNVEREVVVGEVPVALHQDLSGNGSPFTKVEAERVDRRQRRISRNYCQVLQNLFEPIGVAIVSRSKRENFKGT